LKAELQAELSCNPDPKIYSKIKMQRPDAMQTAKGVQTQILTLTPSGVTHTSAFRAQRMHFCAS